MRFRRAGALLLAAWAAVAHAASGALPSRQLLFPVHGYDLSQLRDTFDERRGKAKHEALDIMAKRGTPVLAVDDGRVVKLFRSVTGGITLYQFDAAETVAYYYAHLDRYAPGIAEGRHLKRGDVIGYVGSTGNAAADAPHLHFAIFRLGADRKWWKGEAVNPYPYFVPAPQRGAR
jgi:peptidoglycan LD-endopeptidase LytH